MKLRPHVPAEVRAVVTDERRLAWGLTSDGVALVATASTLYVGLERLAWTQVERVVWRPSTLTITEVAEVEGSGRARSWDLEEDAHLAETIQARVTSSVAWSDRRVLVPSGAVRLVGRRAPTDEVLQWQIVWEPGTNPDDPGLRAQAEQWVEALRRTIG